jgi:hypothetical protein
MSPAVGVEMTRCLLAICTKMANASSALLKIVATNPNTWYANTRAAIIIAFDSWNCAFAAMLFVRFDFTLTRVSLASGIMMRFTLRSGINEGMVDRRYSEL